jgi:type IV pilus assembly protein PilM
MSFFQKLTSSFVSRSYVGVDVGTASIKVAEVVRDKNGLSLERYAILETTGYLERFNEALQTSNLKIAAAAVSPYLKIAMQEGHFKGAQAIGSVPAFAAFSSLVELPAKSDSEIKRILENQANQYVPLSLTSIELDWSISGTRKDEDGAEKTQVMIVAIPRDHIQAYRDSFSRGGLHLASVELEGLSLARSLTGGMEETALIIDIGARSTSFSVAQNGNLKFSGQTDFAGASITQTVAQGLGVNQRRAESLKRQRGLMGFGGEHELSTLMMPLLDVIISEAKRVKGNYEGAYRDQVARVLLSGGGSNLLGIEEYMGKYLQLPTEKANPFRHVSFDPRLEPVMKNTGPLLAVAVGLGMKALV